MKTIATFIAEFTEFFYIMLAGVMGFFSAYLRQTIQQPDRSMRVRVAEALLCAMFSSSLAELAYIYGGVPLELAMPIGVFAGYLGAPTIVSLALAVIKRKAHIGTGEGK